LLSNAQIEPFKGAKRIVMSDSLSKEQNFKLVITTLIDNGWQIEAKDLEYGTIETKARTLPKDYFETKYTFFIKDSLIILSGQFKNNIDLNFGGVIAKSTWNDLVYSNNGKSTKKIFADMYALSAKLTPISAKYE
jgi:hypothetical protein